MINILMSDLTAIVENGRATGDPRLENDGSKYWKKSYWMES